MFMNGNLYEERGEDRRIRKSKKALQEALIRLLSKKSIGEITIKELTDEADVHRGTFYHHYSDAMDLKVQTEREIAEQLTEILSSVPQSRLEQGPYPLLVRVLEYLEDNREIAKMLASEHGAPWLMEELCAGISERCLGAQLFGEQLKYGSRFWAAGLREMLVSWIEDGMRMAPGEMARIMERMMGSQSPTAMSR